MSATLISLSRGPSGPNFYRVLNAEHSLFNTINNRTLIMLRYAQHLLMRLARNDFRPDAFWLQQRRDFAVPPPNPTPTPAAPAKAATPKVGGKMSAALKAASEAICGFLGGIAPLVPAYDSKSFVTDERRKFWDWRY